MARDLILKLWDFLKFKVAQHCEKMSWFKFHKNLSTFQVSTIFFKCPQLAHHVNGITQYDFGWCTPAILGILIAYLRYISRKTHSKTFFINLQINCSIVVETPCKQCYFVEKLSTFCQKHRFFSQERDIWLIKAFN